MDNRYLIEIECENCGETGEFKINKGMSVGSYIAQHKPICESCGCYMDGDDNA